MLVHSRKKQRYAVQMPMTSLIDIVFMLLIYFLLTTNFMVDEGIKIKLPQARAAAPQTEETITVTVDVQGRVYLGDEMIAVNELFDRIKERIGGQADQLVVIRADGAGIINRAVKVMDIAKAAGAGRLCLATEKEL